LKRRIQTQTVALPMTALELIGLPTAASCHLCYKRSHHVEHKLSLSSHIAKPKLDLSRTSQNNCLLRINNRGFKIWHHAFKDENADGDPTDAATMKSSRRKRNKLKSSLESIVKLKLKGREQKTPFDVDKAYAENVHITTLRAMTEFMISPEDLEGLPKFQRRSPFEGASEITVYLRSDVEKRAIQVWGSKATLEAQQLNRQKEDATYRERLYQMRRVLREYRSKSSDLRHKSEASQLEPEPIVDLSPVKEKENIWSSGAGRVVGVAVGINFLNFSGKLVAWFFTGSSAMFSEAVHSLADTINQMIIGVGLYQSAKQPDLEHPYGYVNMRYVSCLISGVGIFCVGAGLSMYHGINGLINPPSEMGSFFLAYVILGATFLSESVTLVMSINEIRRSALEKKMYFWEYVSESIDPSVNVILLEDSAAVLGVGLAGSAMLATTITGNPMWDSLGCCGVGVLLGAVASFIIYSNTVVLVGRSIQEDRKSEIYTHLENDRMIRALHDVKATDMGNDTFRFKAEVDFDGKELTRSYLHKHDLEDLLAEIKLFESTEEVEAFMLKHGENIVDSLGAEVDRIEKKLRQAYPELRHVDLEVL